MSAVDRRMEIVRVPGRGWAACYQERRLVVAGTAEAVEAIVATWPVGELERRLPGLPGLGDVGRRAAERGQP